MNRALMMLEQWEPQIQQAALAVLRLAIWLIILAAIFVPLERLFAIDPQKVWRKGIFTDISYYFLNSLMTASFLSIPTAILAWFVYQMIPAGFHAWTASFPFWMRAVVAFIAGETGYYWGHRLCHENRFLWRFHAIHHSAEHIDFLVNSRAHPLDMVFGRFCSLIPIYILGLSGPATAASSPIPAPADTSNLIPVLTTLASTLWGFFIHANLRWRFGPLEWLISTPAFHHWHHTLTPINRNYASTLPWLDRIFGTHYLPRDAFPAAYGIRDEVPNSILDQLAWPLDPPRQKPMPPAPETREPVDNFDGVTAQEHQSPQQR